MLQKPQNDDFAIIGGHVSCLETTAETLKREFEEELHVKIEIGSLFAVGEVFFLWGQKPCHQICLYYKVNLLSDDDIPLDGSFHKHDDLDNESYADMEETKEAIGFYIDCVNNKHLPYVLAVELKSTGEL